MTINELQIQLDLNQDHRAKLLNGFASKQSDYFLFVDSDDEQCYLFDKNGNEIDIANLKSIGYNAFSYCISLTSINFKGKTIEEVQAMKNYPWGIKNESIVKCV